MSWFESPQYMKNLQKIKSMSPEDKAVNQVLIDEMHGMYADADMRKQLDAMRQSTIDTSRTRAYELAKERQDFAGNIGTQKLNMAQDEYDFDKSQNKTAEMLGYGNIGLAGLRGYADMVNRKKLAGQLTGISDWIKTQR